MATVGLKGLNAKVKAPKPGEAFTLHAKRNNCV